MSSLEAISDSKTFPNIWNYQEDLLFWEMTSTPAHEQCSMSRIAIQNVDICLSLCWSLQMEWKVFVHTWAISDCFQDIVISFLVEIKTLLLLVEAKVQKQLSFTTTCWLSLVCWLISFSSGYKDDELEGIIKQTPATNIAKLIGVVYSLVLYSFANGLGMQSHY
jgi:hypothetical protein